MTNFCQLNDDILYDVFKFLDFEERLRFEAIDKRWAQILNGLWRQTKTLNERYSRIRFMSKICLRCPNLRTLSLDFRMSDGRRLAGRFPRSLTGEQLARRCPLLQTVLLYDSWGLNVLLNYVQCLRPVLVKDIQFDSSFERNETDDLKVIELFQFCPKLNCLDISLREEMVYSEDKLLSPVLTQLKSLHFSLTFEISGQLFQSLLTFGLSLEKLDMGVKCLDSDWLQAIGQKLTQLKSIGIYSDLVNVRYLKSWPRVEDMFWAGSVFCGNELEYASQCRQSLEEFLQEKGTKLRNISIVFNNSIQFGSPFIQLMADFCPHLRSLRMVSEFCPTTPDFRQISRLQNLVSLALEGPLNGIQNLGQTLVKCSKLREVSLNWLEPGLEADLVVSHFIQFSKQHPKRSVSVNLYIFPASVSSFTRTCGPVNKMLLKVDKLLLTTINIRS